MDPVEDLPPPPAFFPSPAPAAVAPPPAAPAAASPSGPKIFVLSPLPGYEYDVDRYYYSPAADISEGDYAALLTFAAHYGHPLAIYHCPDIAAFQVTHPSAIIRPFSEIPPPILRRGRELQLSSSASAASPPFGSTPSSVSSPSILSHPPVGAPARASSRGHDPPSVATATRASSIPPSLRLRPGRLLSLPPVVQILTDSTAPLLSSEWGVLGELGG